MTPTITLVAVLVLALITTAHWMRRMEKHMSALDDKIAELQADVSAVKADHEALGAAVKAEADEIASLKAQLAAGEPVTQAQLDALEAIHKGLSDAVAPPAEPPPAAA